MSTRELRVAPNIYKVIDASGRHAGWRVYVRGPHPKTGKSRLAPVRFKFQTTLEELEHFRDTHKLERRRLVREQRRSKRSAAAGFRADANTYLELPTTKAMPSFTTQKAHVDAWVEVFGDRPRRVITTREIDQQLQRWIDAGLSSGYVNRRRTALMAMFTALDGRSAANPVREAQIFEEPELEARGIPFRLVQYILDAIPAARTFSHKRKTKVRYLKSKPRIELEALTGMRPSQIGRMERGKHFSVAERWYIIPRSDKGKQRRRVRNPRPSTRKLMTERQAEAFQRFDELDCYGEYSASSRRRIFNQAVNTATEWIRAELQRPDFSFPKDLTPRDLRHSFGTEMLRITKNEPVVAELLDHSTTRMTKRYALGAIPDVLADAARAFEAAHADVKTAGDQVPRPPKAPRRRSR